MLIVPSIREARDNESLLEENFKFPKVTNVYPHIHYVSSLRVYNFNQLYLSRTSHYKLTFAVMGIALLC